jgi:hypothetical protein
MCVNSKNSCMFAAQSFIYLRKLLCLSVAVGHFLCPKQYKTTIFTPLLIF